MKTTFTIILILMTHLIVFSQNTSISSVENPMQKGISSYAYIRIEGKVFSSKLSVDVDLGDNPDQKKASKEYSDILSNSTSRAAVLNFMENKGYDLVQSMDLNSSYQGSGGTSGIIFIMKYRKD